jgi:hypothetical protein
MGCLDDSSYNKIKQFWKTENTGTIILGFKRGQLKDWRNWKLPTLHNNQ